MNCYRLFHWRLGGLEKSFQKPLGYCFWSHGNQNPCKSAHCHRLVNLRNNPIWNLKLNEATAASEAFLWLGYILGSISIFQGIFASADGGFVSGGTERWVVLLWIFEISLILPTFLISLSRSANCICQFITNNHASFHLWWKENLFNHQKGSKYYEHDFRLLSYLNLFDNNLMLKYVSIMSQINNFKVGIPVFNWTYRNAYESVTIFYL